MKAAHVTVPLRGVLLLPVTLFAFAPCDWRLVLRVTDMHEVVKLPMPTVKENSPTGENSLLGQRLRTARKRAGFKNQIDLARAAGINTSYISRIEKNERHKLSFEMAEKLASALRVSREWLLGEDEGELIFRPEAHVSYDQANAETALAVIAAARKKHLVPLLSYAQAGYAVLFEVLPPEDQLMVATDCRDPHAFALKLRGESMLPYYAPDDIVVVAPSEEPRFERLVVAQLAGDEGVCFKVLNVPPRRGAVRLSSYNPAFPPLEREREDFDWIYRVHSVVKRND